MSIQTKLAITLCQFLHQDVAAPFQYAIAGGAARDINSGLTPKDYDVVVVGPTCEKSAFELIKQLSVEISRLGGSSACYFAYGQAAEGTGSEWKDDFTERLYACLKVSYGDINLDFLIQRAESIQEALDGFDCNLNQYIITGPDSAVYMGRHPQNELHFLKDVRSYRKNKMTSFFEMHVKEA